MCECLFACTKVCGAVRVSGRGAVLWPTGARPMVARDCGRPAALRLPPARCFIDQLATGGLAVDVCYECAFRFVCVGLCPSHSVASHPLCCFAPGAHAELRASLRCG